MLDRSGSAHAIASVCVPVEAVLESTALGGCMATIIRCGYLVDVLEEAAPDIGVESSMLGFHSLKRTSRPACTRYFCPNQAKVDTSYLGDLQTIFESMCCASSQHVAYLHKEVPPPLL
jgi:hypothetical protein